MRQTDLVINMSSTPLETYESEAIQLGLKFDIGLYKNHYLLNIINTNYRHRYSDFDKDFIQGLNVYTTNHYTSNHTLPGRYISALTNLTKNSYIYIYISGDSCLFLLLVPPPPSVNFSSQPMVRGPRVSHHSCYCVILHCIAQIDKRTLHGVFFVNNQDTI